MFACLFVCNSLGNLSFYTLVDHQEKHGLNSTSKNECMTGYRIVSKSDNQREHVIRIYSHEYRHIKCISSVPGEGKEHRICSTQWLKLTCQDLNLNWSKQKVEIGLMKFSNQACGFSIANIYAMDICSE